MFFEFGIEQKLLEAGMLIGMMIFFRVPLTISAHICINLRPKNIIILPIKNENVESIELRP